MPTFNAGSLVDPLDYTFEPFNPASGRVPEPNDKQIGDFLSGLKQLMTDMPIMANAGIDIENPVAALDALNSLTGDDFVKAMHSTCDIFAGLCSGSPSAETLRSVPIRPRLLFFQWVQQEVLSPEGSPAAGTPQAVTLRPAAGG